MTWYRKAAEQGFANAQYDLASMYEAGRGTSADLVAAFTWFDLAARAYSGGADRRDAIICRDRVASKMTSEQITKAKKMTEEWKPKPAQ